MLPVIPVPSPSVERPRGPIAWLPMSRLLLVRHGESEWNADGRWQGQADPPLTERGRRQALVAAERLGSIDAVVTSDLERAADTGAIMARELGIDHVATEPGLRERDAGPLSGLTRSDIHLRFPGLLPDDPNGFEPGPDGEPRWPEGWESEESLWARVEVALHAVARLVAGGDALVITHGGVMYAVERRLGAPGRGRLSNLSGVEVGASDGSLTIGERVLLVDPEMTLMIEGDRI